MNKLALAKVIAEKHNMSPRKVDELLATAFNTIIDAVKAGQTVDIRGFGVFKPGVVAGRRLYDVWNKKVIQTTDRNTMKFKLSNALKNEFAKS